MKKDYIIILGVIIVIATGLFFFGRTDNVPRDGTKKIMEALKAREVPVVVVTEGQSGANGEFLNNARAATAGADRVAFIHINTKNPVEKEAAARFPQSRLPLVLVLGLDGVPAYEGTTSVDAAALKAGIAKGLTKKPVEIPKESAGEQEHSH
jgi:hypothetical protein